MCRIYASTDPERYESCARSVRLNGFVTSVRLENEFWCVMGEMASEQNLSVAQFIAKLHDEVEDEKGEVGNLTFLLRVACTVAINDLSFGIARACFAASLGLNGTGKTTLF